MSILTLSGLLLVTQNLIFLDTFIYKLVLIIKLFKDLMLIIINYVAI